jgi:integrase
MVTRGPLSPKSIQNVHICLRSALNQAVDDRLIRANPALKARSFNRSKHRTEMKTWTVEEVQRFLEHAADQEALKRDPNIDRDVTMYRVALMTGLRRGELLGLRWRDLDLPSARLHVRQQYTRDGDQGLRFKGVKTGSKAWRTIDIGPGTVDATIAHREAQQFERRGWGENYQDHDLVFRNPDGSPYDPDVATRRFERRARLVGLVVIKLHEARHTHATPLLENGESLKYVAERLGDRENTVLEICQHVTAKMRTQAPSRLEALIEAGGDLQRPGDRQPDDEARGLQ